MISRMIAKPKACLHIKPSRVAQLVEHHTFNVKVLSSILSARTKLMRHWKTMDNNADDDIEVPDLEYAKKYGTVEYQIGWTLLPVLSRNEIGDPASIWTELEIEDEGYVLFERSELAEPVYYAITKTEDDHRFTKTVWSTLARAIGQVKSYVFSDERGTIDVLCIIPEIQPIVLIWRAGTARNSRTFCTNLVFIALLHDCRFKKLPLSVAWDWLEDHHSEEKKSDLSYPSGLDSLLENVDGPGAHLSTDGITNLFLELPEKTDETEC